MKKRLDEILIRRGVIKDKNKAFIIITEGKVVVNGQKAVSPAQPVDEGAEITVTSDKKYVGRGAYKLEAALKDFKINVSGKICLDIGSATGCFVEVLLNAGAKKVYAVDTATGKLDIKLREDPRVVVLEDTNILYLESLPEAVNLVTIDTSFTSLRLVLPVLGRFFSPLSEKSGGEVIALFKPQYETRNPKILRHGIVKDGNEREKLLKDFVSWAGNNGWSVGKCIESPIKGSKGNTEYLVFLIQNAK